MTNGLLLTPTEADRLHLIQRDEKINQLETHRIYLQRDLDVSRDERDRAKLELAGLTEELRLTQATRDKNAERIAELEAELAEFRLQRDEAIRLINAAEDANAKLRKTIDMYARREIRRAASALAKEAAEAKCPRCEDWSEMGLSSSCPSCDAVALSQQGGE